jgi:cyclic pyranopterin phosphate synthase
MSNETRILLTPNCNFRCIFCHREGNAKSQQQKDDKETLSRSIKELIENGCRDITFTGGEPLLKKKLLLSAIQFIRSIDKELPITIVSNVSYLTQSDIKKFATFGNIRFNVSYHTADDTEYRRLTNQKRFSLEQLRQKLANLQSEKIPFKMNAVVLRSTMSEPHQVAGIINFAKKSGAISCKLIELLIVEDNKNLMDDYLAIDSVEKNLPAEYQFVEQIDRGKIFKNSDNFMVELRKCRCHYGCEQCVKKPPTASLDNRGQYWVCFSRTDKKENLARTGYAETAKKGKATLDAMVQQYGKYSPSLIRPIEMVAGLEQVWFTIESDEVLQDIIVKAQQYNTRTFNEFFFTPLSLEQENTSVVVIHCILHDPKNAGLILADISVTERNGLPVNHISFFDSKGSPVRGSVDYVRKFLSKLGWTESFSVCVDERQFIYNDVVFSLQKVNGQKSFVYVNVHNENGINLAKDITNRNGIKPIDLPYHKIMSGIALGDE